MIDTATRQVVIERVQEAVAAGARRSRACDVLGLPERTLRRWERRREAGQLADQRAASAALRTPTNKLTEAERAQIILVCNRPEFKSLPPTQIVPRRVDEGRYLASESTF